MARTKGLLGISQNFEPEIASAFDARANVPTKADLTIASNWTANDGGSYLYNGMTVTVAEDTTASNNGIYILLDKDNITDINSWQQVGEDFPYTGSAQITGSLGVSGSVDLSYARYAPPGWSTGGTLSSPRYRTPGGAGNKSSALAFGGYTYSTYIITGNTEEYNNSTWTTGGSMGTARNNLAGFGSQNAAVAVGGNKCRQPWRFGFPTPMSCTEEYNGASWSPAASLTSSPYGRNSLSAVGTQNAGLAFGGYPEYVTPQTEEYDGSVWSQGGTLSQTRYNSAGAGTQNAALMFGGASSNTNDYYTSCTEAYNGCVWSTCSGLSLNRYYLGGSGTQNGALAFGGYGDYGITNCSEYWDGQAWSTEASLNNGRYSLGSTGNTKSSTLAFGGINWDINAPYNTGCTEEFGDGEFIQTTTFTYNKDTGESCVTNGDLKGQFVGQFTGSFTGSLNGSLLGTSSNAVSSSYAESSSFSSTSSYINPLIQDVQISGKLEIGGNLKTPFISSSVASLNICSTQIIAKSSLLSGCSLNIMTSARYYDVNAFSYGGCLNQARQAPGGAGGLNAALAFGGFCTNPHRTFGCTEEYNGTTWSEVSLLNRSNTSPQSAGFQNSALSVFCNRTEEYNGNTWSIVGDLNNECALTPRVFGSQNAAVGVVCDCTEEYNGNTWSNAATFPGVGAVNGVGVQNAGIITGVGPDRLQSYKYDGTTWSESEGLLFGVFNSAALGSINNFPFVMGGALSVGSYSAFRVICHTQGYNGATWSLGANLPECLRYAAGVGNRTGALFGGCADSDGYGGSNRTIEFNDFGCGKAKFNLAGNESLLFQGNGAKFSTMTGNLTTWSINNGLLFPRDRGQGKGNSIQSSFYIGGTDDKGTNNPTNALSCSEKFDGTAWTDMGGLNNGRLYLTAIGTQNSALAAGGQFALSWVALSCTEEYNGSSWSTANTLQTPLRIAPGSGTQNAGLIFGGVTTCGNINPITTCTEEYNGTTWSTGGSMNHCHYAQGGTGTQNAALSAGGYVCNKVELYDGSTWSEAANFPIGERCPTTAVGTQNDALVFIGRLLQTYSWDGTTFTNKLSIPGGYHQCSYSQQAFSGGGTGNSALLVGAFSPISYEYGEIPNSTPNTTFEHTNTGKLIFSQVSSSLDFIDDTAAAAGGVPLGGIYRSGSLIRIRLV